ncbi:dioxygenase [Micromonospora echinospora]|uniref:dioxygenase family protein n=1 Tax=Micromonospora echinospora TaxID=1877 RepID=UPI0037976542
MPEDRVAAFAGELVAHVRKSLVRHEISYADYQTIKTFLIDVGEAGEWPLLLDILFEQTVETFNAVDGAGAGAVEGPFYVPDAPLRQSPCALPQRPDEPGQPLRLSGVVRAPDGTPLPGAVLDTWQADATGGYSHFAPELPAYLLRARVVTDAAGRFDIRTIVPGAYQVPAAGPSGRLFALLGKHPWRPAHLHFKVSAPDHRPLTTQLYFADDPWLDSDVAEAVKDELVLKPRPEDRDLVAEYDFVLATEQSG